MRVNLSFTEVVRVILREHPAALTPQQIKSIVKISYPSYYGTESHVRNVEKGNYTDIDHALLAQIYLACRSAREIYADRSQTPHRMSIEREIESGEVVESEQIEGENLDNLAQGIGTLYVLGTNLYTESGSEIVKIGITTGTVDKRIAQLYTTGVPYRFRIISQLETTSYSKLEQALHCLFDKYRINKAREFFTDHCLEHIPDLIDIHLKIEQASTRG